jgi:putative glutamine amidotransferase
MMMKISMKRSVGLILIFSCFILLSGCESDVKPPMKIAVTKASKNYINWLKKGDSTLVIEDMYPLSTDSALEELDSCSGLLVTGGEDIQPGFYGKSSCKDLCAEIDPHRDTMEIALIKKAIAMHIPVLGICRGEQIINVALGGTLIVDIPAYFRNFPRIYSILHKCDDYLKCYHSVHVFPETLLDSISGCDTGMVTSNHHQAVDRLAKGLVCNARSLDGLTEGIEWENPFARAFLLGVQWHPERMDTAHALSGKVLQAFLNESKKYRSK